MEAKTNYTLVGLMVLILTIGLLIGSLWLSTGFQKKEYKTYVVYMRDSVNGLNEESAVKFNGVTVGSVYKIELNERDPRQVKLLLRIDTNTPITTSTVATLVSQGITGTTHIGLSTNSPILTPLKRLPNQPYPIIPSKSSLFSHLDKALKEISDNIDMITVKLNAVLSPKNLHNFQQTLSNIRRFTDVLAKNSSLVHDLKKGIAEFNNMAIAVREAGKQVSSTMVAGKVSFNKVSQQALPPTVQFIERLNVIASHLEKLSQQLNQNPAVIVRGTAAPKPGPGE